MNLKNLPFALNPNGVSFSEGLRAGIAIAVTLLTGQLFNLPLMGLAALGALLTCLSDPGGAFYRRAPAVITFALFSGIIYAAFGLIRAEGPLAAAPLAGLMIFCASFARIYGQAGMQSGNLLCVVTILALDVPDTTWNHALRQGLNIDAGAAFAAFLTLIIWRVHPYAPARQALAEVTGKLGALAKELASLANAEESVAAFEAHAASHRRGVRDAIEAARNVAFETFRRRGLVTARAAQLSVRLQTLEHIFSALIALSDSLESDSENRHIAARPIRLIAGWLAALGPDIERNRTLDSPKKRASLQRLRDALARIPAAAEQRRILDAIAEHLAVLITVSTPAGQTIAGGPQPEPWRTRIFGPIRANFNTSSAAMRHAGRIALMATPALYLTMRYGSHYAHWATITMVFCLQPFFSATWLRAIERIAGTALGGLLAAAIGLIVQSRLDLALIMLPLTMFAFTIRAVSYGAFMIALTPMIVLLVEQIIPGDAGLHIAISRVFYTVLGGCLAIFGNLVLWPGFAGGRLEQNILAATKAHAAYVNAVFTALLDGTETPDAARRAAGMSSNNLEAALSRALLEPHKRRDPIIERGAIVDAALRRMAGRLSVLALDRPVIPPIERDDWLAWKTWLETCLRDQIFVPRPPLPATAGGETLSRLARQVELIAPDNAAAQHN
jgi:uncharacterized membrane protein YccC